MKVISFINMKGGVAKTTLAVNVADCLVRRKHASVLCVDVDPQFNATQCLMTPDAYVDHRQQNGCTIVDVFDRQSRTRVGVVEGTTQTEPRTLESITPVRIKDRFDLLPGSLDLYRLEMAPGQGRENRLRLYLETVQDDYDYVIIDTPPTPSVWMTSALIASDHYVIPVRPDPISLTGIDLLRSIVREMAENFGLSTKCAGVVLTVVEQNTRVFDNAKENLRSNDFWKEKLFEKFLVKRTQVARQQLDQILILDGDNSEVKLGLAQITEELLNRIETHDE
ncbi:MAG: ParA family protein [Planctomycetaceae bacterium]|nr:ParA family protein [Planctomycetaceae bacterium]MCA9031227.1 ParA family protein [Planctomycetaceae bacterium]MCB9953173.1 ParA family protein [Planctomycetaceae bacterium]